MKSIEVFQFVDSLRTFDQQKVFWGTSIYRTCPEGFQFTGDLLKIFDLLKVFYQLTTFIRSSPCIVSLYKLFCLLIVQVLRMNLYFHLNKNSERTSFSEGSQNRPSVWKKISGMFSSCRRLLDGLQSLEELRISIFLSNNSGGFFIYKTPQACLPSRYDLTKDFFMYLLNKFRKIFFCRIDKGPSVNKEFIRGCKLWKIFWRFFLFIKKSHWRFSI